MRPHLQTRANGLEVWLKQYNTCFAKNPFPPKNYFFKKWGKDLNRNSTQEGI
jgi:hypothetical protein